MDRDKLEKEFEDLMAAPEPFKREKEYRIMQMKLQHAIWKEMAVANGGFKPIKKVLSKKK